MVEPQKHWDQIYASKTETAVSWYQRQPTYSLALISAAVPRLSASILDVGGAAARLVDELLALEYEDITVLDVSSVALAHTRERLGRRAENTVSWIRADITDWVPYRTWDVWHDRAVFHFLIAPEDQDAYITTLIAATEPDSTVVMSAFALDGPACCSGLPVQRYSPITLAARLGSQFVRVSETSEKHLTPSGDTQNFMYAVFRRQ